jgi:hypothetical protein
VLFRKEKAKAEEEGEKEVKMRAMEGTERGGESEKYKIAMS